MNVLCSYYKYITAENKRFGGPNDPRLRHHLITYWDTTSGATLPVFCQKMHLSPFNMHEDGQDSDDVQARRCI